MRLAVTLLAGFELHMRSAEVIAGTMARLCRVHPSRGRIQESVREVHHDHFRRRVAIEIGWMREMYVDDWLGHLDRNAARRQDTVALCAYLFRDGGGDQSAFIGHQNLPESAISLNRADTGRFWQTQR